MSVTTPQATYRLQLRAEFGLDDAAAVADYLAALGISHVHASPYLQAASGSAHGYDVVVERGAITIALNLGGNTAHLDLSGEVLLASEPDASGRALPRDAVVILRMG